MRMGLSPSPGGTACRGGADCACRAAKQRKTKETVKNEAEKCCADLTNFECSWRLESLAIITAARGAARLIWPGS